MTLDNPLLKPYDIPPLDKIKTEHFEPAIEHAIQEAEKQFAKLKEDNSPPDFNNTAVPLDRLFSDMVRITSVLGSFMSSRYDDALIAAEERIAQSLSAFAKTVYQDAAIAKRFQAIAKPAHEDDQTLYKHLSQAFESEGAFLSPAGQERIREIDGRLIGLCSAFNDNLNKAAEQQAVFFTREEDVAGLPQDIVSALRKSAEDAGHDGDWLVIPERLQVDMLLEIAASRSFRQKIFEALNRLGTQTPYDNEPIIKDIQALRHERAKLLGYSDHAAYALSRTMAASVARAQALMDAVVEKALPKLENTVRLVQAFAVAQGGPNTLEPWDLPYWANRYKQDNFSFDGAHLSEYLPLDRVTQGFFSTAGRLFGVEFHENAAYPRHHADVQTYDVLDSHTKDPVGILYADFFARPGSKHDGAWMSQLQEKLPGRPDIVTLNMNLLKPETGFPLLSLDDMGTLFHEGGHALHGLLGTDTRHPSLQGTSAGSSDYTEFFSTLLESWPQQKEVLNSFARHYRTGQPVPEALFQAMERSRTFFAERDVLKIIQNSCRDFAFHTQDPASYTTSQALQRSADFNHPLAAHIRSYPFTRWSHLFSDALSGYAAGYYGYLWSQGLAELGFQPFQTKGVFDPQACERLRRIYRYGTSRDMNRAYAEYYGNPLTPEAMAQALLQGIGA